MWTALRNTNIGLRLHSVRFLKRCFELRRNLADYSYKCAELNNRKLIVVKGKDSFPLLQGMISNDARHLYVNDEASVHLNCIYSFLLHFNGRVFADLMMYTFDSSSKETTKKVLTEREGKEDDTIFVECDASLCEEVFNCLKTHKLRKKVDLAFDSDYSVYSVFPNFNEVEENLKIDPLNEIRKKSCLLVKDPRLNILGYRLLKQRSEGIDVVSKLAKKPVVSGTIDEYSEYRYKLGIGEGCVDHPSGSSFPLECNADILHGVSFHKGCYIGQELTARVYHTGVIRKRLMPIQISDASKCDILQSNDIIVSNDKNKTKLGKLRSKLGIFGLALLNVEEVVKCGFSVLCKDVELKVTKPHWWPKIEQRDQIPCGRADHEIMQLNGVKHCNY